MGQPHYQNAGDPRTSGPGFGVSVHGDAFDLPLTVKKPQRWFVNSMSDLFHPDVPDDVIAHVVQVMSITQRHTYQVLTKRPQRMAGLLGRISWDLNGDTSLGRFTADELGLPGGEAYSFRVNLPNVWWGTSIESDRYCFRADHLRAAPASIRFLSLEPLLGPLPSLDLTGIDWVIVGGESGPGARPMDPAWVRDIRDRSIEAGIPLFIKQWGTWVPYEEDPQPPFWQGQDGIFIDGHHLPAELSEGDPCHNSTGTWWWPDCDPESPIFRKVGKKRAGRLLDGELWDQYPLAMAS
jgi:protein gp37